MKVYILWRETHDLIPCIIGVYSTWEKAVDNLKTKVEKSIWFDSESDVNLEAGTAISTPSSKIAEFDPYIIMWVEEYEVK